MTLRAVCLKTGTAGPEDRNCRTGLAGPVRSAATKLDQKLQFTSASACGTTAALRGLGDEGDSLGDCVVLQGLASLRSDAMGLDNR